MNREILQLAEERIQEEHTARLHETIKVITTLADRPSFNPAVNIDQRNKLGFLASMASKDATVIETLPRVRDFTYEIDDNNEEVVVGNLEETRLTLRRSTSFQGEVHVVRLGDSTVLGNRARRMWDIVGDLVSRRQHLAEYMERDQPQKKT